MNRPAIQFGVPLPRGTNPVETVVNLGAQADTINPYVVAVAVITLASGILLKRFLPRFPYMIGAMLVGIVLLVAPLATYLPNAAMAAVLMLVAWGLVDFHHIGKILRASRSEAVVMIVTFMSALLLDLEFAILFGVVLSLVTYLNRTSRPNLHERASDPSLPKHKFSDARHLAQCPQLRMVRVDGSLFFGAISHVTERIRDLERRDAEPRDLALICSGVNFIDVAGAEFLTQEKERLRREGRSLYLFRVKPAVRAFLERGGYMDQIGEDRVFNSKETGVTAAVSRLNQDRCADCTARVFAECQVEQPSPA